MAWRKQQGQDRFFQQAKREGYRARSAYKLLEINEKFQLLRPGAHVLDLGAAPGSWSQVVVRLGRAAQIFAIDIQAIEPLAGVETLQADITAPETAERIAAAFPQGIDLVLSDVAPATSGVSFVDQARSAQLAQAALQLASRFLRRNGAFVVKIFQGEDFRDFVAQAREHFEAVRVYRPEASRSESTEHFVVCQRPHLEKRDAPPPPAPPPLKFKRRLPPNETPAA
jgi:23S rRNA (uridine2552-2'-O)-methyltransferase